MKSRFAYHNEDDQPQEGGVHSVNPARPAAPPAGNPPSTNPPAARSRQAPRPASSNGVPGPGERLLDITELARTIGMHYTHVFALAPEAEPEIKAVTPISGKITLTNAGASLILRGNASASMQLECGRCLNPIVTPVETELEEQFDLVAAPNAAHHEEVQAVDENPEAAVVENNILNLGELLRQSLLLAAPLQPDCSEDCPYRAQFDEKLHTEESESNGNPALLQLGALWAARQEKSGENGGGSDA